jgi:magnesium-transporting ATPase (P-type)
MPLWCCAAVVFPANAFHPVYPICFLQVQYVLSDKTGTLTQNVMGFVWASVGGVLYGQHASEDKRLAGMPANTPHSLALDEGVQKALCFRQDKSDKNRQPNPALLDFFTNLAVCNTVVPSVNPDGSLLYQVGTSGQQYSRLLHSACKNEVRCGS